MKEVWIPTKGPSATLGLPVYAQISNTLLTQNAIKFDTLEQCQAWCDAYRELGFAPVKEDNERP